MIAYYGCILKVCIKKLSTDVLYFMHDARAHGAPLWGRSEKQTKTVNPSATERKGQPQNIQYVATFVHVCTYIMNAVYVEDKRIYKKKNNTYIKNSEI